MIDCYKILKVEFGATETEIKKEFRKLATIYHPDKNKGSTKSEELFIIILNAYKTLSDKEKRFEYDKKYKEYFQKETHHNYSKTVYEFDKKKQTKEKAFKEKADEQPIINYKIIVILIIIILWLISRNEKTTTGNTKADYQLENQKNENRPESGEIDFKNEK